MKYRSSGIFGNTELETGDDMNWRVEYPDMAEKFKAMELRAEHQRLQSAVVEMAIKWRKLRLTGCGESVPVVTWARNDLSRAVDALIVFDAEHKIGEDQ